jgi:hypothetical protein
MIAGLKDNRLKKVIDSKKKRAKEHKDKARQLDVEIRNLTSTPSTSTSTVETDPSDEIYPHVAPSSQWCK